MLQKVTMTSALDAPTIGSRFTLRRMDLDHHAGWTRIKDDAASQRDLLAPVAMNVATDNKLRVLLLDRVANRAAAADLAGGVMVDRIKRRRVDDQDAAFGAAIEQRFSLLFVKVVAPIPEGGHRDAAANSPEVDLIDLAAGSVQDAG